MSDGPGILTRAFVYGFLALFALCAVRGVEWWPLTGWKLFSQLRTGVATGWEVVTVDHAGDEHRLAVDTFPRGYRGVLQLAADFPHLTQPERDGICRVWGDAAAAAGADVAVVRVYRTRAPVRTDFDAPAPPAERTARYDCG